MQRVDKLDHTCKRKRNWREYALPTYDTFATLTFEDTSGWHIGSVDGDVIDPSNLTAAYYKSTLKTSKLVKE